VLFSFCRLLAENPVFALPYSPEVLLVMLDHLQIFPRLLDLCAFPLELLLVDHPLSGPG